MKTHARVMVIYMNSVSAEVAEYIFVIFELNL